MKVLITLLIWVSLFVGGANLYAAGFNISKTITWETTPKKVQVSPTSFQNMPSFTNCEYLAANDHLPTYIQTIDLPYNADLSFKLTNAKYEPLETSAFVRNSKEIGPEIIFEYEVGQARKQYLANIYFVPIIKDAFGQLQRVVDFELEIEYVNVQQKTPQFKKAGTYAANSVLRTGSWYKIAVAKDGIYKLDASFLSDLGVDVNNIDPRNIQIYGNGGGILSESAGADKIDDLVQNAIYVEGENDGSFDANDYVLFYGKSPHQWSVDSDEFVHSQNIYSDKSFYFLTVGNSGKRLGNQGSAGSANTTVTDFSDRAFHELEETNLIASGREWYGDYLTFNQTTKSWDFIFPNRVTSFPVKLKSRMCARSIGQIANFSYFANGQSLGTQSVDASSTAYLATYAKTNIFEDDFNSGSANINIAINLNTVSSNTEAWLDYIEVNVRRGLIVNGTEQLLFRDLNSVGAGNVSEFRVSNTNGATRIWEITDPANIVSQQYSLSGSEARFTLSTDVLREFVAFSSSSDFLTAEPVGSVSNQNLHNIGQPDMIIVTGTGLEAQANQLANHHRTTKGLEVAVVPVEQIYNEFASGTPDLSAIRNFVKMLYDRAGSIQSELPQYLLLFGNGSYDYKDRLTDNTNFVPTFESRQSLNPVGTFVTDDYFGFLDDTEGESIGSSAANNKLDIAIGRLNVSNVQQAQDVVNKIIHYESTRTYGNWRNWVTFVADDEDGNIHLSQANDQFADYMETDHPVYNIDKIYLDAYTQVSTPGGTRYPDAKAAINRRMFSGNLVMSYTGHGGVNGWALERILDNSDINSWTNFDKLPVFLTATCEFSKFDDPKVFSSGEQVFLKADGGAIAMVTTVRVVFSGENATLTNAFLRAAFEPYDGARMPTLGEALTKTKNAIPSSANNRKFMLLGDPAVTMNYPRYNVVTTSINGLPVTGNMDTLKALEKVTIRGEVRNLNGDKMLNFDGGFVFPTIFDKSQQITTLKNDPSSSAKTFSLLKSIIFNGKASITNGEFEFTFIVPKDIAYNIDQGKISYYAENRLRAIDAHGYTSEFLIGGTADAYAEDNNGPDLDVYMNDEKFVFGGTTDENPLLLVDLFDFSGINTVGNGIGHDITGILDGDDQNTLVLNEFYESDVDDYQRGSVRYPLAEIEDGRHTMAIKAWDVYNNAADGYTEFVVAPSAELALNHVLNYPNPFTTNTSFHFEHNRPGESLFVQVKVFTVSGKLVKTIQKDVLSDGYRVDDISWDGLDDFGDKIGRGAYVYKVSVSTPDGEAAHKFEKLVILR